MRLMQAIRTAPFAEIVSSLLTVVVEFIDSEPVLSVCQ